MSCFSGLLVLGSIALARADMMGCMRAAAGLESCGNPIAACTKGSDCQTALSAASAECTGLTDESSVAVMKMVTDFPALCAFYSDPCISLMVDMSSAKESCKNPVVDCPAGNCSAGNAIVSKCGAAGWEMPAVPASMKDSMNTSMITAQVAMLKAAGCTGSGATITTTTTTTPSPIVITGSISMTGISAADVNGNATLKAAVASGIATALGVPPSYVVISVSRRLNEQRQLQSGSATISYTITIPSTSTVPASTVAANLGSDSISDSLKTGIQTSLTSTGAQVTVSVTKVTFVTTTTAAPSAKASGAVVVKFGLPLVFLAMSL